MATYTDLIDLLKIEATPSEKGGYVVLKGLAKKSAKATDKPEDAFMAFSVSTLLSLKGTFMEFMDIDLTDEADLELVASSPKMVKLLTGRIEKMAKSAPLALTNAGKGLAIKNLGGASLTDDEATVFFVETIGALVQEAVEFKGDAVSDPTRAFLGAAARLIAFKANKAMREEGETAAIPSNEDALELLQNILKQDMTVASSRTLKGLGRIVERGYDAKGDFILKGTKPKSDNGFVLAE